MKLSDKLEAAEKVSEHLREQITVLESYMSDKSIRWAMDRMVDAVAALELIGFAHRGNEPDRKSWRVPEDGEDPQC